MPCGLNTAEVNTYDINGCAGNTLVVVDAWVDEKVPKPLAYDKEDRGIVTCLAADSKHATLPSNVTITIAPGGGDREC